MSSTTSTGPEIRPVAARKPSARRTGGVGDRILHAMCALAGVLVVLVLADVIYQVIHGANPALSQFGLSFIGHTAWVPNKGIFGAAAALYGTLITALIALAVATPLGIAIGVYLSMMAPAGIRTVVGPLVEMLAAIPSVIVGFWGVAVLAPFAAGHLEPFLHGAFGFIPLFGASQTTGLSLFTAGLGLTVMVLPIIAALSRDLFLTVPDELKEGAAALGATRWEVIRGIVLPTTASGVAAATVLGLGRALGEAIAVLQMVGDGNGIHKSLFLPGTTLASKVANEFNTPESKFHVPSLFYLALVLLVIGLITSLLARVIARHFDVRARLAG